MGIEALRLQQSGGAAVAVQPAMTVHQMAEQTHAILDRCSQLVERLEAQFLGTIQGANKPEPGHQRMAGEYIAASGDRAVDLERRLEALVGRVG